MLRSEPYTPMVRAAKASPAMNPPPTREVVLMSSGRLVP